MPATPAVYAALIVAKLADEQAAQIAIPLRNDVRLNRRSPRAYYDLRN